MKKDRLEWVMSGLNQHALTNAEDQFIKIILEDFDKNQALTDHQEKKLEDLYKWKSRFIPNKNKLSVKKSSSKRGRPRKLFAKDVLIES